ncbi:MAG: tRNA (N(6)-L-threonylcarbamoyladenosine(37)-C(2))-methylthiotransferase MtaB [Ruminococcaceae bacterium]|nr:tRNA (N(6)-L-threonylcarbamoyladenosine(37)-C(2))-methylthiotransferase MtaB [Oscillospiraceae bacterium]
MNIAFYTLGCKVNQYETEVMREAFEKNGHTVVSSSMPFDVIIINSCTVTAESDRKTRQAVHRFKKQQPNAVVVLTGCMAQAFSEDAKALLDADIVIGNTDVSKIYEKVCEYNSNRIFEVIPHPRDERYNTPSIKSFAERTRAYMKIQDGCDRFCTYCIIPTARGWLRSKPIDEIKKEAEKLSQNGYVEAVLVGINLTSYGKGKNRLNICDAVEAVAKVSGIKRIRLGSLEPDHITDEMLMRLKAVDKFCPQFHLSLQSGCDATLKRMNRHYDTAFYRDLVNRIRAIFPDASITTDIMVGFAGETEEEFQQSIAFAKEIGFAKAHVFAYSRREGTMAYNMPNQVTRAEKSRRSRLMIEATAETEGEFIKSHLGKTVEVLFETQENGWAVGYTKNYLYVKVKSDDAHTGELLNVKITDCEKEFAIGEII